MLRTTREGSERVAQLSRGELDRNVRGSVVGGVD